VVNADGRLRADVLISGGLIEAVAADIQVCSYTSAPHSLVQADKKHAIVFTTDMPLHLIRS
jgi:hypothetical protein